MIFPLQPEFCQLYSASDFTKNFSHLNSLLLILLTKNTDRLTPARQSFPQFLVFSHTSPTKFSLSTTMTTSSPKNAPTPSSATPLLSPTDQQQTETPLAELHTAHAELNETFLTTKTKSYEWRKGQLEALRSMCIDNLDAWTDALALDLNTPKAEAILQLATSVAEIDHILDGLWDWMKDENVSTPLLCQPASS